MATEQLVIQVREDGTPEVKNKMRELGQEVEHTGEIMKGFQSLLGTVAALFAVEKILSYAEAYNDVGDMLRTVTSSASELEAVTSKLFATADLTRSGIEATTKSYVSLRLATKDLGLSQQDTINLTSQLQQIFAYSGVSAEQGAASLQFFAKALQSGKVEGREFIQFAQTAPEVLNKIAQGMDLPVSALKNLAVTGQLSSKQVIDALNKVAPEIATAFAAADIPLGGAFRVLENSLIRFFGRLNEASGFTNTLSRAMIFLANNLEATLVITVALIAAFNAERILAFARAIDLSKFAMIAFNAVANLNPFVLMGTAIAVILTLLFSFRDSIKLTADGTVTMGTVFRAAWNVAGIAIENARQIAYDFYQMAVIIGVTAQELASNIVTGWGLIYTAITGAFTALGQWLVSIPLLGTLFQSMYDVAVAVFTYIGQFLGIDMSAYSQKAGEAINFVKEQFISLGEEIKTTDGQASDMFDSLNTHSSASASQMSSELGGATKELSSNFSSLGSDAGNTFSSITAGANSSAQAMQQLIDAANSAASSVSSIPSPGSVSSGSGSSGGSGGSKPSTAGGTSVAEGYSAGDWSASVIGGQLVVDLATVNYDGFGNKFSTDHKTATGTDPKSLALQVVNHLQSLGGGTTGTFNGAPSDYASILESLTATANGLFNSNGRPINSVIPSSNATTKPNIAAPPVGVTNSANRSVRSGVSGSLNTLDDFADDVTVRSSRSTQQQQRPIVVNVQISTPDANSFKQSRNQVTQNLAAAVASAARRL
jgi:tape measure domain-containing protein